MKATRLFCVLTLILFTAVSVVSCSDLFNLIEDPEENVDPPTPDPPQREYKLTVSPNGTVLFPAGGGAVEFTLTTNTDRYGCAYKKAEWLTMSLDEDRKVITATVTSNDSGEIREFYFRFYCCYDDSTDEAVSVTVNCTQLPLGGEVEEGSFATSAQIDFGGSSASGCGIVTMAGGVSTTSGNTVQVTMYDNADIPQIALVLNQDDEILAMARDLYPDGTAVSVDARSTALAFVTMYPLFAPVKGQYEFGELKEMIQNASAFGALENEMAAVLRDQRPVFDPNNSSLIGALEDLLDEICIDPAARPQPRITNVTGVTGEGPFIVSVEGKRISITNTYLTPMYSGWIYNSEGEEVARMNIPSGSDYGVTDMIKDSFSTSQSTSVTFDFNSLGKDSEGQYNFHFSRTTEEAVHDLCLNCALNILDIAGASISLKDVSTIKGELTKIILTKKMAYDSMMADGKAEWTEIVEFSYGVVMDALTSDTLWKKFAEKAAPAVAKNISVVSTVYSLIRGSGNALTRTYYRYSTPEEINFCLCNMGDQPLYSCGYVTLELVSGNYQEGITNVWLEEPIRVRVNTGNNENAPSRFLVHFTVSFGQGTVSDELVFTDSNLEAQTWWKLGPGGEYQELKVEVLDIATNAIVSESPIYPEATNKDSGNYNKAPVPEELLGTWVIASENINEIPVSVTLGDRTASFSNPPDTMWDLMNIPVWSEELPKANGKKRYNLRFYDDEDIFLGGIMVMNSNTLYVEQVRGGYSNKTFVKQGDIEPPIKYASLLCEFVTDQGSSQRISMYAYANGSSGPSLDIQQAGKDYKVTMTEADSEGEKRCSFWIRNLGGTYYQVQELKYDYETEYVWDSSTNPVTMENLTYTLAIDTLNPVQIVNGRAWWVADNNSKVEYQKKSLLFPEDNLTYMKWEEQEIGNNCFRVEIQF